MSHLEVLETELRRFQVRLSGKQACTLVRYCDELSRWNEKVNLTGLHGTEMVRRLVVEPVWIASQLHLSGTLVDIGSGNGSPAIPFQVVSKLSAMHLVEPRVKRAAFLRHVVSFLKLGRVTVHRARIEEIGSEVRNADWVTIQGVAVTLKLFESIKTISSITTRVVWITSALEPPRVPFQRILVPFTNTEVLIFQLDLS